MKIDWIYFKDKSIKSVVLVIIQFSCLGYLIFSATPYPTDNFLLIPYFLGIFLGIWAVLVMQKEKLNISPDPHPDTKLITKGPYYLIRHPMYLAIFLVTIALLIDYYSINRLVVLIILFINLVIKLEHEEKMLKNHLPHYSEYRKRTWRLIPLLY